MILSHVFRNSMILGFFKWCFSFILLGGRLHFTICLFLFFLFFIFFYFFYLQKYIFLYNKGVECKGYR